MPVQPPLQPATLAQPHPPTSYQALDDVAVESQEPNPSTADNAARTDVYKTNIISADSAEVPAWFQPALAKCVAQILPAILEKTIPPLLAPTQIMAAKTRNRQLFDGSWTHFVIVLFLDGSMPTQPPHNLPPLINVEAIRALGIEHWVWRRQMPILLVMVLEMLGHCLPRKLQLEEQWGALLFSQLFHVAEGIQVTSLHLAR